MSTYKCRNCGTYKNDTVSSQLNTSTTCNAKETNIKLKFHNWEKIAEEDLVCS
ncbi:hypothetical protein [Bizionia myxarmorum]|uniref:hypothetical protein n=1 Tax=Bizionia myxarmorum TaxID=291186 RepID=UPI0014782F70|nr:hypothetical protein [Bizionia myxarmorum]